MKYHAPTQSFVIDTTALKEAAMCLRFALRNVRQQSGFPLEPHKRQGPMTPACHAERALIDLGGTKPGQIDLRDSP
jgi:hypothetical protein